MLVVFSLCACFSRACSWFSFLFFIYICCAFHSSISVHLTWPSPGYVTIPNYYFFHSHAIIFLIPGCQENEHSFEELWVYILYLCNLIFLFPHICPHWRRFKSASIVQNYKSGPSFWTCPLNISFNTNNNTSNYPVVHANFLFANKVTFKCEASLKLGARGP